ncbi:DNA mismatch repair protein MutL [Coniophora puteana RWD-64-598 SS2]|uniref:DNA mismatch repair protein MutL n=1 Tax=Coniophora puteana (strain RWD-64-598) TaxID=741705 RepID=A0A5M3MDK2_CONPW|nr:DNA mismatch repair protein MutL [Coniophora puteana RWD-64-598 SS2]EIW77203.1 DNA mismatch repair protein MutL [Coniophora puteana RWD-64-598 SS2]
MSTDHPRSPTPPPAGPLPIRRLHESLINRIAAGEIIHRPASALKELIENSLDAGATFIRVTVKDGGMKLLQIQDNGCGIRKADLPLLAERFTTSKLTTFSDLSRIRTYGFRGEALASISHVAHLSVMTKTKSDTAAWKAHYADGALTPPKSGLSPDPKPCAGNDGTTITIENMFYNTPTRLSALRSSSEEYSRILDVMTRYAVHNPNVSFSCKKSGVSGQDLSTPSNSDVRQTIRLLYGHAIYKDLLHAKASSSSSDRDNSTDDDDPESWSSEAYFTNANYQAKKTTFLLFINHRLVESSRIKRALESVYSAILPKGMSPFMYLSLDIDPQAVDVNVHPTKREVHFLNEEAIIENVTDAVQQELAGQTQSRVFQYQTLLTGGLAGDSTQSTKSRKGKEKEETKDPDEDEEEASADDEDLRRGTQEIKKTLSQHKVRTSQHDRTLDSMFPVLNPDKANEVVNSQDQPAKADIAESFCDLTSIQELRQECLKGKHHQLTEILEKHTFVGVVDLNQSLSLIQHSTKLYLVNHGALAEELFYQLALRQFGEYGRMRLEPPPSIRTLVKLAIDVEDTSKSRYSKEEIVEHIVSILMKRREMLADLFSLRISDSGELESLPLLLGGYTPNLDKLPMFLMRLGPQVNWNIEKACFNTLFHELAYFYSPTRMQFSNSSNDVDATQDKSDRWQIQHVLFKTMRKNFVAPKSLLDSDVVQIASLPDLYRVFERC